MTPFDQMVTYKVEVVNFNDTQLNKVRVMLCQLDFDQMDYEVKGRLRFVTSCAKNNELLRRYLNIACGKQVDLLVFPELTIPSEFVSELMNISKQYDLYIIGGTHYKKKEDGYVSVCPIVTPNGVYETEKINPAPMEQSSFKNECNGAVPGKIIRRFNGTKIGDFAVTICLDYSNDDLRNALEKDTLDFLIVSAFNPDSENFYYSMHTDVQHATDGLNILYSNCLSKQRGVDGRSALFAFMDNCYKSEFKEMGRTDGIPSNKIYELSSDKSYCIFDLDLEHKKPYKSKNSYTKTNVEVVEEDSTEMDKRHRFAKGIGASESRYLFIDKYYVKPLEYDDMLSLLEKEGVLVIVGDPGIGKTYTAIHFLYHYTQNGYRPTWFYGLGKEDRDKQREHLMNFEPHESDIIYIEDPFGRTVFENREELKTLFGNLVQKFRSCKAKLIITSRTEVFKQFENGVLSSARLEEFKKELNVRNPSYSKNDLKKIAGLYLKDFTNWWNEEKLVKKVMSGIEAGLLISPLMLYNLAKNHPNVDQKKTLEEGIRNAQKSDLTTQFAEEIKMLALPTKILLYLVLFYIRKNISLYKEMFDKVQAALLGKCSFDGTSFTFELRSQDEHRIQRLGVQIPVYRFSHPAYEEALIMLANADATCYLVAETCLSTIIEEDGNMAADIFRRFITRYPKFLEQMMKGLNIMDFARLPEQDKIDLTQKMILSGNETFINTARKIYPIKKLIGGLYEEGDDHLFVLRLKSLNRRKDEIEDSVIDWQRVFKKSRIRSLHPSQFIICYNLAVAIDGLLMDKIAVNLQKTDIIRKYILLPTNDQREKLAKILSMTSFKDVYQDLKTKIPDDLMSEKINKYKYASILRKYVLRKEAPKGKVFIDYGAMKAIQRGAKLYPVGVIDATGDFKNGDIVYIVHSATSHEILSLVEMSSEDIMRFKGLHSPDIYEAAGDMINTVISRPAYREKFTIKKKVNRIKKIK